MSTVLWCCQKHEKPDDNYSARGPRIANGNISDGRPQITLFTGNNSNPFINTHEPRDVSIGEIGFYYLNGRKHLNTLVIVIWIDLLSLTKQLKGKLQFKQYKNECK